MICNGSRKEFLYNGVSKHFSYVSKVCLNVLLSDFIVWKWFVWGDFYDRIIIKDLVLYNFNLSCFFQTRTTINWAPHRISINQHLFEHSTDASSSIIITIIIIIVPCRMCYMWVHWRKDLLIFVCACTKQSFAFFWCDQLLSLFLIRDVILTLLLK